MPSHPVPDPPGLFDLTARVLRGQANYMSDVAAEHLRIAFVAQFTRFYPASFDAERFVEIARVGGR